MATQSRFCVRKKTQQRVHSMPITSSNNGGSIKVGANLAIDAGGVFSAPPPATNGALILLANVVIGNQVTQIDFLSLFSAAYDSYLLEGLAVKCSNTDVVLMRLANACVVDGGQNYASMANSVTSDIINSIYATGRLSQGGKGATQHPYHQSQRR